LRRSTSTDDEVTSLRRIAARRCANIAILELSSQECGIGFRHAQEPTFGPVHEGSPKIQVQQRARRENDFTFVIQ